MSRRILGHLLFAVALFALLAGFQIAALVCAMTGLFFIASTARAGGSGRRRSGSGDGYRHDGHRGDNDHIGGGDGDFGGGGDGGGGGD